MIDHGKRQTIILKIKTIVSFIIKRINGQYLVSVDDLERVFHGGVVFGKYEGGTKGLPGKFENFIMATSVKTSIAV